MSNGQDEALRALQTKLTGIKWGEYIGELTTAELALMQTIRIMVAKAQPAKLHIRTQGPTIALAAQHIEKFDDKGVVRLQLTGMFPNYGSSIKAVAELQMLLNQLQIPFILYNDNDSDAGVSND